MLLLEPAVAAAVVVVAAAVVVVAAAVVVVVVLSVYCSCAGFEVWKKANLLPFLYKKISLFPIKMLEL